MCIRDRFIPTIMVMVTDKKFDTAMLVGARPNFVKVAPLLNKFEENNLNVLFIHTGQHWEKNMSEDIFRDLGLREPDVNLNIQNKNYRYKSTINLISGVPIISAWILNFILGQSFKDSDKTLSIAEPWILSEF